MQFYKNRIYTHIYVVKTYKVEMPDIKDYIHRLVGRKANFMQSKNVSKYFSYTTQAECNYLLQHKNKKHEK